MDRFVSVTVFVLFTISGYLFYKYNVTQKTDTYLKQQTIKLSQDYQLIYNNYKKMATLIYQTKLNTPKVKKIVSQVYGASPKKKDILRKELYAHLQGTYKLLKSYDLKQLHFHLKDNESFLRFHKPKKYDDNLAGIRSTVVYVNKTHKAIDGFEEGRHYNGYRFVFPLEYQGKHIGSVEASFSTLAMSMEFYENYGINGCYLISKEIADRKLFNYAHDNYVPSQLEGFYYEKAVRDEVEKRNDTEFLLSSAVREKLKKEAFGPHSFSLYDKKYYTVYTVIKIINPVTKKVVALFILKQPSTYLSQIATNSFALFLAVELLFAAFLIFIYRMRYEKRLLNDEVKKKTAELQTINAKMEEHIHLIDQYVIISSTDLHGRIIAVSDAFCKISGYRREELVGNNHNIIRHPDMKKSFFTKMWQTLQHDEEFKGEIKNQRKDGSAYWVDTVISPNFNEEGEKVGYTAIRQDITNKKKIEEISVTDMLTNIHNRRYFNEQFPKIINQAKRKNEYIAFLMIDIDHFKRYNDTYGHQKGDEALQKVAACMKTTLKRANDHCFRLGGEEFAVMYEVKHIQEAWSVADKLRDKIEHLEIEHKNNSVSRYVTVSIGLMCLRAMEIESESLLYQEADKLLYLAKENGRNCIEANFNS
ncbi:MAG: diguanylate cyclase [Sulfurimonas sp.]